MMNVNFGSRRWFGSTSHDRQQKHQMISDDDSLAYSQSAAADDVCSLRALELIRQLSFDINTPEIVDICDTKAVPKEHLMISPPLKQVFVDCNSAGITPPSLSSSRDEYIVDFDDMYFPNRRRLLSEQSPYAVSSASSSTCGDSYDSSLESGVFSWDDHSCRNNSMGLDEEDVLDPPLCTCLNVDMLQKWNMLCEHGSNHGINEEQQVLTATAFSGNNKTQVARKTTRKSPQEQVNCMQQEFDEAIQSSMYLSFTNKATERKESHSQLASPRDQGKGMFSLGRRQKVSPLFSRKNKQEDHCAIKVSPATTKFMSCYETEKNSYPMSPDRTVATFLESCCSEDRNEYF